VREGEREAESGIGREGDREREGERYKEGGEREIERERQTETNGWTKHELFSANTFLCGGRHFRKHCCDWYFSHQYNNVNTLVVCFRFSLSCHRSNRVT